MRGKNYKGIKEKAPAEAVDVAAAVTFLKENVTGKFDQTIELHVKLGVDHTKSDQMLRATVTLPSGTAKQKKIAVLADEPKEQEQAREAGATIVGGDNLIKEIESTGKLDADIVVATPAMMPKISKVARVLGPQGLMPNPKTGTVSADPAAVVRELAAGKVTFKMDALGNIHETVGKVSWDAAKTVANVVALMTAIRSARPTTMKGQLIKSVTLKATMSPAVRVAA